MSRFAIAITHECRRVDLDIIGSFWRFEPSSRNFLTGEQPDPWELLHPQDKLSRHRGAEQSRRYGLSGSTSLLSPE